MLSSIMKSFDNAQFDELYMKLIDKHLRKNENVSFFFLSNQQKDAINPSKSAENIKYLVKNLSLYNKLNYPLTYLDDQLPDNESNSYLLLDKVSHALRLLEIFGSSSFPVKELQMMSVQPNFLYNLKIYYNRKHLVPRSAKVNILAFNKFFLDITKKNLLQRSYQCFYALVRGADNQLLQDLDLLNSKPEAYKLLDKNESIHWEIKEDLTNFSYLNDVFKSFMFTKEDVDYVYRTLALILHIGNLEFEKSSSNEVSKVKNMKSVEKVLNIKDEKVSETLEKCFVTKIKVNIQQKQIPSAMKVDEAISNLNRIVQDLYEKLFIFVTMKINKLLFNELVVSKQSIADKAFKEVSIIDVSNNSNFFSSSNVFNLLHFYVTEKSFQLIEETKIDAMLTIYERSKYKYNRVVYQYANSFDNILRWFEHPKTGFITIVNEYCQDRKQKESEVLTKLESNKTVLITKDKNNCNVTFKHVEGDYNFSLNGVLEGNIIDVNYNLINILEIMINNIRTASEDVLKVYLQENGLNTFFNIGISNFSTFLDENAGYSNVFVCYIPQENFESNLEDLMKSPKSLVTLNQIRKMRVESYVENVLNKFCRVSSYKDFYIKYETLNNN